MACGMYAAVLADRGVTSGFTPLPWLYWPLLAATLLSYCVLAQGVKTWLLRKGWI